MNYPIALEGALKLKEISYIHAEGYPAGEMKHGPIALIDENMPIVALVPSQPVFGKMMGNLQEAKARGAVAHRGHRCRPGGLRRRARPGARLHRAAAARPAAPHSHPGRRCPCSCSRTTLRSCGAAMSISRATWPRASRSSSRCGSSRTSTRSSGRRCCTATARS